MSRQPDDEAEEGPAMEQEPGDRRRPGRPGEATVGELSIALFVLALFAFSPPMLAIFGAPELVAGVPLLYVYLFAAWGLVIVLVHLLARRAARAALHEREAPATTPPDEG